MARVLFVAAPVVGTAIWVWHYRVIELGSSIPAMLAFELYWLTAVLFLAWAMYGVSRLVQVMSELYATRTELAEFAIGRERIRVSRDLHDLLGQSLSAVSLKGDLAIRLLADDSARAKAEIESPTGLAREALHDMRQVASDKRSVSFRRELDAAIVLLDAIGIAARVDVEIDVKGHRLENVLSWAVREGTTNLLRHSDANACSISLARSDGVLRLVIANDGVRDTGTGVGAVSSNGSGLAGLAERAQAARGTVDASLTGDGWYRLVVELPASPA
jgi:two-component system sensor histidine kinase DesK